MSSIRTLIIDDDVAVAGIHHGFLLARGGFDVVSLAHTGQQGLDLAAELRPELVLLDIHLPDMSGLDVLQQLRGRQQALDVLVITASRELETVRGAMAGGVLHYLVKPFTSQALNERLDEYLLLRRELAAGGAAGPLDQDSIDRLVAPSRRATAADPGGRAVPAEPGRRGCPRGCPGPRWTPSSRRSSPARRTSRRPGWPFSSDCRGSAPAATSSIWSSTASPGSRPATVLPGGRRTGTCGSAEHVQFHGWHGACPSVAAKHQRRVGGHAWPSTHLTQMAATVHPSDANGR